jgi:endonuclease/exonuclease/phosphatase family metal-dependent hydrolase
MRRRKLRKIVTWNCRVGRGSKTVAKGLAQLIKDENPDVICLQEAMNYVTYLRLRFPLWRIYCNRSWDEADNCPVMVRRTLPRGHRRRQGWGWVRVQQGWVYRPNNAEHPGRTWTWVMVAGVAIMSLHRVAGQTGENRKSLLEETDRLIDWLAKHEKVVIIGDTNQSPRSSDPESLNAIAEDFDARLVFDKERPGIDYALVKGIEGGSYERTVSYGSDHDAGVLTFAGH